MNAVVAATFDLTPPNPDQFQDLISGLSGEESFIDDLALPS